MILNKIRPICSNIRKKLIISISRIKNNWNLYHIRSRSYK